MSTVPLSTAGGSIDSLPGLQATPFTPIPVAEFRSKVLELYRPPLMSRSSYLNTRRALDLVIEVLGPSATTADLTMSAVGNFVKARSGLENPNTTRKWLSRLSAVSEIGVAEGWLRFNPVRARPRWVRRITPKVPRIHSREEIARVLTLASAEAKALTGRDGWRARRLHALASVVAYTGVRKTEALTLQVADVDLAKRMIFLVARVGNELKTEDSAAPVPVPVELMPVLQAWIGGLRSQAAAEEWLFPNMIRPGPWTGGNANTRACDCLQRLGERAGIPGFTFASLRHCWSTHAEYWGLSDAQIARVLRHTTTATSRNYRHAEQENLRAMVAAVSYGPAVPAPGPAAAGETLSPVVRARREHLTPEQTAEILELTQKGWSYRELQERYRCGSETIWRARKRVIPGTSDGSAGALPGARRRCVPLTPEQCAELLALMENGSTLPELMERFKCARSTIYNARSRMRRVEAAATSAGEH